jgi:hypothetical protein
MYSMHQLCPCQNSMVTPCRSCLAPACAPAAASWGGVGLLIQALACREMYGAHIVTAASLSDQLAAARSADRWGKYLPVAQA